MHRFISPSPAALGIERVVLVESAPVSRIDVLTRDPSHAADLEAAFGVRPFRFQRRGEILHAFPRLPAAGARAWLEDHGLAFVLVGYGAPDGPDPTWIQGAFA